MITKDMNTQMEPRKQIYWDFFIKDKETTPQIMNSYNVTQYKQAVFKVYGLWEEVLINSEGLLYFPEELKTQHRNAYNHCSQLFWRVIANIIDSQNY